MGWEKEFIEGVAEQLKPHADPEYAEGSWKYFRNQFDFLGIRTPILRKITKQYTKKNGMPSGEELKEVILLLWRQPEREYQRMALYILEEAEDNLTMQDVPWLTGLITTKSWWDSVDLLATKILGRLFSDNEAWSHRFTDQWIEDDNIWLQRTALLYQLHYKENTDQNRLFRYIRRRKESEEFFVQKAIGWALRQYARTAPKEVLTFIEQTDLKPLSKREALKHF